MKKLFSILLTALFLLSAAGCGASATYTGTAETASTTPAAAAATLSAGVTAVSGGALDGAELFTERDLQQTAELDEAVEATLADGKDLTISAEGVYVLRGTASELTVLVEAGSEDKVQLVLDGVSITNRDRPCIYVKSADKVFVTTTATDNSLAVTGAFVSDGETKTDAAIFSKEDLVLNGLGTLRVSSAENGVSGKDDLKITGGTLIVSAAAHAVEANDSLRIAGGTLSLTAGKDGLHADGGSDADSGTIYIGGGTAQIRAGDDGVHAVTVLQIDGGELDVTAAEGLEGTWVQLNGGSVTISASDDGVNAARKSNALSVRFEMNGGTLTISIGAGDTDGIDANGDLIINGGTVDITGQSPFDYDGTAQLNGGTIIVNGTQTNTITNQMFGGRGGFGGGMEGGQGGFGGGSQGGYGGFGGGRGRH